MGVLLESVPKEFPKKQFALNDISLSPFNCICSSASAIGSKSVENFPEKQRLKSALRLAHKLRAGSFVVYWSKALKL